MFESRVLPLSMSYAGLHFDAKTAIAHTSIGTWNALMRADPIFGRYALSEMGRSTFLTAFTIVKDGEWRVGGKLHRIGGPAYTYPNGTKVWYERGQRHRIGAPACIYDDGSEDWYERGQLHRAGGQPASTCLRSGNKSWYERGKRHRVGTPGIPGSGGPASTFGDGAEVWFEDGRLHRDDGPAITYANGDKLWYTHGKRRVSGPMITD